MADSASALWNSVFRLEPAIVRVSSFSVFSPSCCIERPELEPGRVLTRPTGGREGDIMADRRSLGMIGFVLGGITAVVVMVGATVVQQHLNGSLQFDDARPVLSASLARVMR
jgi:hypothetical protein